MSKKQAFNPYLPSWEYVPDAEPHIVDGRVYVYGSHDLFNGINFCLGDYVCWSAPVDDLGNWTYHGVIFRREQDPAAPKNRITNGLAAPDMVVGPDGRYYLYYFMGGTKMISVAVCDEPAGKYEFYGYVKYQDGTPIGKRNEPFQFDPGCLMDNDGRLYLYTGFAFGGNPILLDGSKPTTEGPMWFEIDTKDMLTVISGDDLHYIGVLTGEKAKGTPYEEQPFGEASSMRRFGDKYYFIYSSLNSHNLCYAVSDKPTEGFAFGGVLISCGDIGLPGVPDVKHAHMDTGNTHGSLIEIGGKYYIFYHRHSNRKQSSRQACAEEIRFEDGEILVKGSSVMKGYYKMPAETEETLTDGWLHTGDKGYMDEDGFLFINGRVKNLIILSNGENISPEEIENKLGTHPLVAEVVITGENNGLTARIYPDRDVMKATGLAAEKVRAALDEMLKEYNRNQPTYRRIMSLVVRKNPFLRNATRKIIRADAEIDE